MKRLTSFCPGRIRSMCLLGLAVCVFGGLLGQTCQVSTPPPQTGVTDVTIQGMAFAPKEVTIKKGESVRWTNQDFTLHTATSGNPGDADAGSIFDTGDLSHGESSDPIPFDNTGEFIYFCRHHPLTMVGAKVIVTE
jgi:plastocyanin